MRFERVRIAAIAYELPSQVVTSAALDDRLAPLYDALRLGPRQIEALTGIRERRFWPVEHTMSEGALRAAKKALPRSGVAAGDVGMLLYAGVCRDNLEPATACAVADGLGVRGAAQVFDVSNACLGVLNGMLQVASAIELGHIRAGMVVSCESARQIVELMIERLLARRDMETFKTTLATMTGGSGAIAIVLAESCNDGDARRVRGAVCRSAPQFHRLCRWGPDSGVPTSGPQVMETHAIEVLENGVRLGTETWADFLLAMGWEGGPDRIVCHQVGAANRDAILKSLRMSPEKDFVTYPHLGNIGTVSLPITAAIAEERGILERGQRVGLLGIGSGLNCVMIGVEW
jgi:3-oxoacyl-[acyl-carrier-protein] synthase-3